MILVECQIDKPDRELVCWKEGKNMAEVNGEQARLLVQEGKLAVNKLADAVSLPPEKVKQLGQKIARAKGEEEKREKPEKKTGKESSKKTTLGELWEAFFSALVMTEGISFESGKVKVNPQPLHSWPKEKLRREYLVWSRFKPDQKIPEAADFKARMIEAIHRVAAKREIFAYVLFGEYWEAKSVLDLTMLTAGQVKKANAKVGEAFERFTQDWQVAEWNNDMLSVIYDEWQTLQKDCKLKTEFNPKKVGSLTPADQAAMAILEVVKHTLEKRGIDPETARPSATAVPRPSSVKTSKEDLVAGAQPKRSLAEEVDEIMAESKRRATERDVSEAREMRAGRGGTKKAPGLSEVDQRLAAQRFLESGYSAEQIPGMLADMATHGHRPSMSARSERIGESVDARAEGALIGPNEKDYFTIKAGLISRDDWSAYGWSAQEKSEALNLLGQMRIGGDSAKNLLASLLLHGETGADALAQLQGGAGSERATDRLMGYLRNLDILYNDDSVLSILIPSDLERRQYLDRDVFQSEPRNIEELAWQIEFETPGIFGKNGPYPVLKRTVEAEIDPLTGKTKYKFRERVDAANIVQWMRYIQFQAHANHTMKPMDFAQETGIRKTWKTLNVYEMLDHKAAMGHSKYGGDAFKELIEYLEVETGLYGGPRSNYLQVWHNKGSAEQMAKIRLEQFYENFFTRPFGGKSMFNWMHQMAESFQLEGVSDGKMGAAINTIFWTYAHIANPLEMGKMLGCGPGGLAEVFNLDNLRKTRADILKGGKEKEDTWLDLSDKGEINGIKIKDVFDLQTGKAKLGTWKEQYDFMCMWNFYAYTNPSENAKTLFRAVVRDRAAKLHGLATTINGVAVPWNKEMAENIAFYNTWFFGVSATNDVLGAAHQWETKTTGDYRKKTIGGRLVRGKPEPGRAGEYGNPYTVEIFKRWLISPFHGIRTTTPDPVTGQKAISQVMDEARQTRFGYDQQVLAKVQRKMAEGGLQSELARKMQEIQMLQDSRLRSHDLNEEDAKKPEEIEALAREEVMIDEWNRLLKEEAGQAGLRAYKQKSEEFVFKEDSMYKYMKDHYEKGVHLDERLRGAKELKFDKYIKYVPFVGATFEQEAWQKDMAAMITDVRYAFQNYGELNYNMKVWDWDPKIEAMRQMTLGESMFSEQLVNIPEFKGKDGRVDWNIVNKKQKVLYKRWLESFIIGQLLQYRELTDWNTNPRYSFTMTEDILDAIAKIPSIVEHDGANMRRTKVTEFFFDKAAMKRIRKESGTSKFKMYFLEILNTALFARGGHKEGFFSGLADALSILVEKSLSGVATT